SPGFSRNGRVGRTAAFGAVVQCGARCGAISSVPGVSVLPPAAVAVGTASPAFGRAPSPRGGPLSHGGCRAAGMVAGGGIPHPGGRRSGAGSVPPLRRGKTALDPPHYGEGAAGRLAGPEGGGLARPWGRGSPGS